MKVSDMVCELGCDPNELDRLRHLLKNVRSLRNSIIIYRMRLRTKKLLQEVGPAGYLPHLPPLD